MSEQEKEIIRKLSDTIPKLDDNKKNYILGVAEGMAIARETRNEESVCNGLWDVCKNRSFE